MLKLFQFNLKILNHCNMAHFIESLNDKVEGRSKANTAVVYLLSKIFKTLSVVTSKFFRVEML